MTGALEEAPTAQLFALWRDGDAEAGEVMAQRFSDWYYAISSSRLGELKGRPPLERACQCFAQGILNVNSADELGPWAHRLLLEEIEAVADRLPGGDQPNHLTRERSPTALLLQAKGAFPLEKLRLLSLAYDPTFPVEEVAQRAEGHGGYPLAVLEARYALKRWLQEEEEVPFTELPVEPNLDRAPLPLYEAGRMQSKAEDEHFEQWMLSDLSLCRDVAEFSAFALALRGGALASVAGSPVSPRETGGLGAFQLPGVGDGSQRKAVVAVAIVGALVLLWGMIT